MQWVHPCQRVHDALTLLYKVAAWIACLAYAAAAWWLISAALVPPLRHLSLRMKMPIPLRQLSLPSGAPTARAA